MRWIRRSRGNKDHQRFLTTSEARAAARLCEEIEAFLRGSSGEWFLARGRDVPPWAYVNKIAHAEPALLWRLAELAPEGSHPRLSWHHAVAILARDTLRLGGCDPVEVRRIQLDRLATLEARLISRTGRGIAPDQVVALGRACLRDHPSCGPTA